MIRRFVTGRVAVFIDAANVFYAQRTLKWRISYERLKVYLETECNLVDAFIYTAIDADNPGQIKFIEMLQRAGFIVRMKPIKQIRVGKDSVWKGNLDIELAMDMLDFAHQYDTMILMSGDSDFAPVIDRLKAKNKRIVVMSVNGRVSVELLERAKFVSLKKIRSEIELM